MQKYKTSTDSILDVFPIMQCMNLSKEFKQVGIWKQVASDVEGFMNSCYV